MNNAANNRIGIFLYYPGSLKFHPSIINSALVLTQKGYQVDIYKPFNEDEGSIPDPSIRVIHSCRYTGNPLLRILSLVSFVRNVFKHGKNYCVLFGIDPYGLLIASLVNLRYRALLVYYSLEIHSTKMNNCDVRNRPFSRRLLYYWHLRLLKLVESCLHKNAALTLIQDETRWNILRQMNNVVDASDVIFIPNSPMARTAEYSRSDYLSRRFGIPSDKKIVLYAGSLGEWIGVDRILLSVLNWSKEIVLVLHGRGNPTFVSHLMEYATKLDGRVIISLDQLIEEEYEIMVGSADIGISWYADKDDPNVYNIGAASGKLFYYLKHRLPVVTNQFPGLPEIVEKHGAGLCVETEADIGNALLDILEQYETFSQNAQKCFGEYEFSTNFARVVTYLSKKIPHQII